MFPRRRWGRWRPGIGARDANHILLSRHRRIVASDAIVARIAHGNHAQTILFRLINCHFHRFIADDLAHAVVAVNDRCGRRFLHDFKIGNGVLNADINAVNINGLKTVDSVGFNAPAVGLQQYVRANLRILARNANAYECVRYKRADGFPVNDGFCHDESLHFHNNSEWKIYGERERYLPASPPLNAPPNHGSGQPHASTPHNTCHG